jgi:hypothetical protein
MVFQGASDCQSQQEIHLLVQNVERQWSLQTNPAGIQSIAIRQCIPEYSRLKSRWKQPKRVLICAGKGELPDVLQHGKKKIPPYKSDAIQRDFSQTSHSTA